MRVCLTICLGLALALPATAQTAERLEEVLAQDELTVGLAAYVAAASGGLIAEDGSIDEAMQALERIGFPVERVSAEQRIRTDQFAFMLMLAHERSGGILYTLFPGPRYAFRELRHERVIQRRGDPNERLSGSRALRLTERVLNIVEAEG